MPFILLGIIIILIGIVLSVSIYPLICVAIVGACKSFRSIAVGVIMVLTVALYAFACTSLEYTFDNWCYSVYAGAVLTPIAVFICSLAEEPGTLPLDRKSSFQKNVTVPALTLFTSLFFAIEGFLRMTHTTSAHFVLNNGLSTEENEEYWRYYDGFQYAGELLFFVSIIAALIMIVSIFRYIIGHKHEIEKDLKFRFQKKEAVEKVKRQLIADYGSLDATFANENQQDIEYISYYKVFCKAIISSIYNSDEKFELTYEYGYFNNLKTNYQALLIKNEKNSFYFYPLGVVLTNINGVCKYLSYDKDSIKFLIDNEFRIGALPKDITPIKQSWLHTCIDGSPDLMYNFNPKTYIYEYAVLSIFEFCLHVYRKKLAEEVIAAYDAMCSQISYVKQHKCLIPKNEPEPEPIVQSANELVIGPKEGKPALSSFDSNKKEIIQEPDETPKTLEGCFYDLIKTRGFEALTDESLINHICNHYKEVEISEYKEIIDKMVSTGFFSQFVEPTAQNDFFVYNASSTFARQHKLNIQKCLFVTQAFVSAFKKKKDKAEKTN